MPRIAFIMEQHLGHLAFYQNVRRFIAEFPDIQPVWVQVAYAQKGSWLSKIPFIPSQVRGTAAGYFEVQNGLGRESYDALVFNTQVPAVLAGSRLKKQPYVICTDITPVQYDRMAFHYNHRPDRPGIVSKFKHRVNTNVFQQAGRILPWSHWTRTSLIEDYGAAPEKIEVNPPGVDIDVWKPAPKKDTGRLRVLFVGGDFYRKGGDVLLEACRGLPEGLVELVLVTRSAVPASQQITVHNNMTPNSNELIRLYQSCDVFVLPSKAEAFGIAAIEACAAGLPVLASPVGGLTDIVENGVNGRLIPMDQPGILRDCLAELAGDPALRRQMGEASRLKAVSKFNAKKNVSRMVDILYDLIT